MRPPTPRDRPSLDDAAATRDADRLVAELDRYLKCTMYGFSGRLTLFSFYFIKDPSML